MTCPLTRRELEMVQGLADGLVYKQIAARAGISASTVGMHLHNAYVKLGVADRGQAVVKCEREGWTVGARTGQALIAYYQGAYDQCRRLLTSPRMNRPQREVIEGEARALKTKLESCGVKFAPSEAERDGGQA